MDRRSEARQRTVRWVAELSQGRSFADIGGLWGIRNEMVTHALEAGASEATLIDATPQSHPSWSELRAWATERGFPGYRPLTCDVTTDAFRDSGLAFDVVHCAGVLYHLPAPQLLIDSLRQATRSHLILASVTVPEVIENEAGHLDLTGGRVVFVPALEDAPAAVLRAHFAAAKLTPPHINRDGPVAWYAGGRANFGPWWWLVTPPALRRMVEIAGFEVLDDYPGWGGLTTVLVCRKTGD